MVKQMGSKIFDIKIILFLFETKKEKIVFKKKKKEYNGKRGKKKWELTLSGKGTWREFDVGGLGCGYGRYVGYSYIDTLPASGYCKWKGHHILFPIFHLQKKKFPRF